MTKPVRLKNTSQGFTAVGAPSIIIVFVILCLTCFAALSLASANAEMRLAARMGENNANWYAADAAAQRRLAYLQTLLDGGILDGDLPADALAAEQYVYCETEEGAYVTLYTRLTQYTALETVVRIEEDGAGFALVSNTTVVTKELPYTELPFIWNGVISDD